MSDDYQKSFSSRSIKNLGHELAGVIADVTQGDGFDNICLKTIKRVQTEIYDLSKQYADFEKQEQHITQYIKELEAHIKQLSVKIDDLTYGNYHED